MAKAGKIQTPDWVLEGYESKKEYEKAKGLNKGKKSEEKTFKIKVCPKCGGYDVSVLLIGEEGKSAKDWECKSCKWSGRNIGEKELDEEDFMKYLDDKGEEVA